MNIVLHIGMAKSGSTALQHGLSGLRAELIESGAMYPESPALRHKHGLMISELLPDDAVPRALRHKYDADFSRMRADARAWWEHVERRLEEIQPSTLILSDEWLFRISEEVEHDIEPMVQRLRALADTVDVVAYVRSPSEFYLSLAQQLLKASHEIKPVRPVVYRRSLEYYAMHLADKLHVFPYDRSTWPNRDVVQHFLGKFVPSVDVPSDKMPSVRNESLSAEAMAVLADYRLRFWRHANHRFTEDTRRLVRALRRADDELGDSRRPQLRPSIRDYLDHASTDLLWLRHTYGVVFKDVDYDAIRTSPPPIENPRCVEDICDVSAERKAELTLCALRHLAEPRPR